MPDFLFSTDSASSWSSAYAHDTSFKRGSVAEFENDFFKV